MTEIGSNKDYRSINSNLELKHSKLHNKFQLCPANSIEVFLRQSVVNNSAYTHGAKFSVYICR